MGAFRATSRGTWPDFNESAQQLTQDFPVLLGQLAVLLQPLLKGRLLRFCSKLSSWLVWARLWAGANFF